MIVIPGLLWLWSGMISTDSCIAKYFATQAMQEGNIPEMKNLITLYSIGSI